MSLSVTNQPPGLTVFIPDVLLHVSSSRPQGIVQVLHHDNNFPPQSFEVNGGLAKLLVHLQPGANNVTLTQHAGHFENGFPHYDQHPQYAPFSLPYTLHYRELPENPAVHLCLLVARDSPLQFDSPDYKQRNEGNGLSTAVQKLRFGARLMQAFTAEQMLRNGFGNRCFRFVEEELADGDTISAQELGRGVRRSTVKVHVIRVDRSVSEIRDPNVAQQNPKGNNTGALYGWAADALRAYGGPFTAEPNPQAACIYMDAHWDPQQNLLLGHAALGGSAGNLRLAIFGSQGLWAWPKHYEELYYCFSDCTKTDTTRVVNDCNECGSAWEAANVSIGAFLHELGHALGCPHQPSGVMLRDYTVLNRSFMSREFPSTRTGRGGYAPVPVRDECAWHRLDIMRFLYHPGFKLPVDHRDDSIVQDAWDLGQLPSAFPLEHNSVLLTANTGIYLIEVYVNDSYRTHLEFAPKLSNSGPGPQKLYLLSRHQLKDMLGGNTNGKLKLEVLSVGLKQLTIDDLAEFTRPIESDFGQGCGTLHGYRTQLCGARNSAEQDIVLVRADRLLKIRVYHGMALDGIRFYHHDGPPALQQQQQQQQHSHPVSASTSGGIIHAARTLFKQLKEHGDDSTDAPPSAGKVSADSLFGKSTNSYSDFTFNSGESLLRLNVRCGAWVDAVQIVTSSGRASGWFGNTGGGSVREIAAPPAGGNGGAAYSLVGITGCVGSWVDGIQGIYVKNN